MQFFKLSFAGLPKTSWACFAKNDNYKWESSVLKDNMIEIGIINAKDITIVMDGKEYSFSDSDPMLCCTTNDGSQVYSTPGSDVSVTCVAVQFPKLHIDYGEVTEEDYENPNILIFPRFLSECSQKFISEISLLLNRYISADTSGSIDGRMMCYSTLFRMFAEINQYVRERHAKLQEKTYNYYVKKVNYIVHERFREKLSEKTVAEELGISPAYLSVIYKEATGINFSQYLTRVRMKHAMNLLSSTDLTTGEICYECGFESESYFRRRFKSYSGVGIREIRYIMNEMTLTHSKPTWPENGKKNAG